MEGILARGRRRDSCPAGTRRMPLTERNEKRRLAPFLWLSLGIGAAIYVGLRALAVGPGGRPVRPPAARAEEQQERELRAAIDGSPGDPRPRVTLARFLLTGRRTHAAVDAAREAAARFPESAPVRLALS